MIVTKFDEIKPIKSLFDNNVYDNKKDEYQKGFKDIFTDAIKDVAQKEKELEESQYLLATGQIQDAHTVPVAAAKAQLSIDLMVTLRNKALESYNELMRINL